MVDGQRWLIVVRYSIRSARESGRLSQRLAGGAILIEKLICVILVEADGSSATSTDRSSEPNKWLSIDAPFAILG
jgi:hypothetical protein